jgi:hypothetical protein
MAILFSIWGLTPEFLLKYSSRSATYQSQLEAIARNFLRMGAIAFLLAGDRQLSTLRKISRFRQGLLRCCAFPCPTARLLAGSGATSTSISRSDGISLKP